MELTSVEPLERDRVRFGLFFLHLSTRQLRHNATTVPLKPKQVELLVVLAERLGRPVSRSEIIKTLWGPQKATDFALSQTVNRLRRALEAFDATTEYVRTIPGVGYHLVAPAPSNGAAGNLLSTDPAFRAYRRAAFRFKQGTRARIVESIGYFEDALALNPCFLPALIGLAHAYTSAGIRSFIDPLTAYYRAKAALAKAIGLDPTSADAFALLSFLVLFFDGDRSGARDAAEQAVTLAPQSPKARSAMVWQLLARQDYSAALVEADRALRANPSDTRTTTLLGILTYLRRGYDEACTYFAQSLAFSVADAPALFYYACALYMKQRYDDALALLDRMPRAEMASRVSYLRGCIAFRQRRAGARKQLESRLAASLTHAIETREPGLFLTTIDPLYEPVWHSHPALIATIRDGCKPRCDRCSIATAHSGHPLYALRLCDSCNA